MMLLGAGVGLVALYLSGWSPGPSARVVEGPSPKATVYQLFPSGVRTEASFLSYYALAFFALRWWRMTSRRRPQRFSFAPILAAGFWGVVLLLLVGRQHQLGAVVLVMAAAIVQLVSPWEPPPAPSGGKKVRLRYA
jgi:hypothetical protein